MRRRAVQDCFHSPSPTFPPHSYMRFFLRQKWTSIFTSSLPKTKKFFSKNFFRNMSGPPRAGHIWTDPGAWFFHLQFYKKYVIIIKKSKISHENFFVWTFYRKRTVHNKRMEMRLIFEILFWQSQARFFLKTADKNFFWKLQAKLATKILYVVKLWLFYRKGSVHYKRMEIRPIFEILFWMRRAKNFLSRWKFFWVDV